MIRSSNRDMARHWSDPILVVAVGLGEMNQVHPVPGPPLPIVRAGEQAIDQAFVRVRRTVLEKSVDLLGRRRQAEQIEMRVGGSRVVLSASGEGASLFSVSLARTNASIGFLDQSAARRVGGGNRRPRDTSQRPPIAALHCGGRGGRSRDAAGASRGSGAPRVIHRRKSAISAGESLALGGIGTTPSAAMIAW